MNFKKYHVSKNLFDPNSTRYHMGKGTNNQIAPFGNGAMFYIEAESNMTYTIKVHTTDSTFVRLYLSNAPIVENVVKSYNVISESETIMNPEVTISNTDCAYLWIQIGGAWYTEHGGSSIMLNTGSEPLPYEPYSSEVWHDVPYYQHKTATDTLTLPAVLYPNDTTATVGLKGNTLQSSIPSPTSPVMPQGTGERTGNLAPPLTEWVNGYVSASGAIAPPSENFKEKSSDYIPVKVGREYTFSVGNEFPGGKYYQWRAIGWYTQDKTFISRASGNAGGALSTSAPSNAVYCRLSYRTHGETTNPMFNTGSTALPYEPYGYFIEIEVS